eukprot:1676-Hanusia_phi.AAC.2
MARDQSEYATLIATVLQDLKQKHLADLNLQKTLDELKLEKDSNLIKGRPCVDASALFSDAPPAESDDLKRNTQHVASKRLKSALAANKVKFQGNKEKLIDVYKKQLRDNYPYRYSEDEFSGDWHYTPESLSHKYRVIPQRYPHKDGSDLGDNYISTTISKRGSSTMLLSGGALLQAFPTVILINFSSSASKTRTPIMLRPVTGFHDTDLTGRYQLEHLKPVVRSMDKGTLDLQHEIFGDDK